jgi:hypothetical protein
VVTGSAAGNSSKMRMSSASLGYGPTFGFTAPCWPPGGVRATWVRWAVRYCASWSVDQRRRWAGIRSGTPAALASRPRDRCRSDLSWPSCSTDRLDERPERTPVERVHEAKLRNGLTAMVA